MDQTLVSIIIVTHNNHIYNKLCVESIIKNTPLPYELIFIDNNSNDGTPEFLKSLNNSVVVENKENKGFAFACNQGICKSKGNFILFLNNDTVVPPFWLENLIAPFNTRDTGITGPVSFNSIRGKQKLERINYDQETLVDFEEFAMEHLNKYKNYLVETSFISGLCMLVSRKVIEETGGFDTIFSPGWFEDDDYCLRVRLKGYKLFIAKEVYIHHFGSKTFDIVKLNEEKIFSQNYEIFKKKWKLFDYNFNEIVLEKINIEKIKENIYFSPKNNYESELILKFKENLLNIEDIDAIRKRIELLIIKENNNTDYLYILSIINLIQNNYINTLEILKKISVIDSMNRDLCSLFGHTLDKLGNKEMSNVFRKKIMKYNNFSSFHQIIKALNFC